MRLQRLIDLMKASNSGFWSIPGILNIFNMGRVIQNRLSYYISQQREFGNFSVILNLCHKIE